MSRRRADPIIKENNETKFSMLYLKHGWAVEDLSEHHFRVTIPCKGGRCRFDYWPARGTICRTGSMIFFKTNNPEGFIFEYLKSKGYEPI